MTDNNTKKKKSGWLYAFNSALGEDKTDDEIDPEMTTDFLSEEMPIIMDEYEEKETQNNQFLLPKEDQDKISIDLIVSVENIIKDRKLMIYKNKDIENQLYDANESIRHLKQDVLKTEQVVKEKNKQILGLENSLTNQQMNYDQVLEDYQEFKSISNTEYEKISIQLDGEINKYSQLNEEFTNSKYQQMLKENELEEKVRNLELEKLQYEKRYKKIVDEKSELAKTINDFTERMNFSLSSKVKPESQD